MRKRLCLIMAAAFLLLNFSYAAELKIQKILTEADGLVSNTVLAIFEDSHGAMWFGTTDGLTRYDGEDFRTFTIENGLAQNTIGLIFEDQQGMLWFAAGVLAGFLDRGKPIDMSWMETPLSELADISHDENISHDEPPKGVSRFDSQTFRIFTTADGLDSGTIKDIFQDEAGTLWFATSTGVSQYDGEKFNNMTIDGPIGREVLPEWWSVVTAIAQDTAENFWFGSTAGIVYYNLETSGFRYIDIDFTVFTEMGGAQSGHLTDLQFDAKDNLWFSRTGTDEDASGIRRYDGKKLTIFPQSDGLPMNSVDTIMKDSKGNLWFTGVKNLQPMPNETEEGMILVPPEMSAGVSIYNGQTFRNFNAEDGLPSNRVWSVFEDSDSNLWFATDAGAAMGVYLP